MTTSIDDLIAAAETKAAEFTAAWCAVAEAHGASEAIRKTAEDAAKYSAATARRCRAILADHRRPKGMAVTFECVEGWGSAMERREGEVVGRTDASVFVRCDSSEDRYNIKDGEPHGQRRGMRWRIVAADLPRIREMPAGENDVSRALKAIEKGAR